MLRDRFLKKIFMFGLFATLVFPPMLGQLGKINPFMPLGTPSAQSHVAPVLSDARKEHILHGDATGGGHLYGTGKACKSEFPRDWSADDIVSTVTAVAANDNVAWQKQKNGNYVAEAPVSGVTIRIVLNRDQTQIITAYPLNTPRNPCGGRPANDN